MASTNKTTNYDLSQYIGSDKPTYLSDYNGDMLKIDTAMKTNADNISTAVSSIESVTTVANQANTTANTANTNATTAVNTANSANTTAGNAQSTANSALSTATTAQSTANTANTKVDALATSFNIDNFTNYNNTASWTKTNTNLTSVDITVATNSAGDVFKVYGEAVGTLPDPMNAGYISIQTDLRPESNITINCAGIVGFSQMGHINFNTIRPAMFTVSTTGLLTVKLNAMNGDSSEIKRVILMPCLYFGKDFGDTPIPESN